MLSKIKYTIGYAFDVFRFTVGKFLLKLFVRYIAYSAMKQIGLGKSFDMDKYENVTAQVPSLLRLYKPVRTFIDREKDIYYLVAEKRLVGWGKLDGLAPEVTIPKDCRKYNCIYNYFLAYATNDNHAMNVLEQDHDAIDMMVDELSLIYKIDKSKKTSE